MQCTDVLMWDILMNYDTENRPLFRLFVSIGTFSMTMHLWTRSACPSDMQPQLFSGGPSR